MTTLVTPATTDEQRVNELVDQLLEQFPPKKVSTEEFLGAQFDLGLAWVSTINVAKASACTGVLIACPSWSTTRPRR